MAPVISMALVLEGLLGSKFKGEIRNLTRVVEDFNTPLTTMDRISRQKSNKDIQGLNNTMSQLELTGIYRTDHSVIAEYAFFSSTHKTFTRIDHILGHQIRSTPIRNEVTGKNDIPQILVIHTQKPAACRSPGAETTTGASTCSFHPLYHV